MKTRDSGRLTACVFFVFLFFVLKQIVVEKPVALFLYLCQRDASVLLLLQTQGFLRLFLFSQALVDEHGHLHRVVLEGANERLVQARRRLLPFRFRLERQSLRLFGQQFDSARLLLFLRNPRLDFFDNLRVPEAPSREVSAHVEIERRTRLFLPLLL